MKIAIISTTIMPCPPAGYSGLEMLAWQQACGLSKNHEVTLIAPKGSVVPEGVSIHETTQYEPESKAYSGYWHKLPGFDCIIDNSWEKWSYILKIEGKLKAPILGVMHAPIHTMYATPPPVEYPCLVAISKDQSNAISEHLGVNSRVAYNGIDIDFYKMNNKPRNNRYLFLARFSKIKGAHIAVDVARKCRISLDLVGDDTITGEPEYVQRIMAQSINNIKYIGPQSRIQCAEWFNSNKVMLHMNREFREPFGLAPVEAMACGMPVIAFDNGAMRETVKHGETGFIIKNQDEVEALIKSNAVATIKAQVCREWASQFSVENMIKTYESLCIEAIDTGGW